MSSRIFQVVILCLAVAVPVFAGEDWKTEADARIEKHRKEDVSVHLLKDGKPLSGADVRVEMVRHEFLFGCNIFKWNRCETPEENDLYKKRYAELFNFATLGFYWWDFEYEKDRPKYDYADEVADWCLENGIKAKGHPLAWNFVDPFWAKDVDDEEMYRRQMERNAACTERFRDKIEVWDVINEVVRWDRPECRKNSSRLTALMENRDPVEYAKSCFLAARKGNPKSTLLINDFDYGPDYVALIEKLVDENKKPLYDAIGIQSHMHGGTWDNNNIRINCERFATFGVPVHFTELTVLSATEKFDWSDQRGMPTTEEGEARQRDEVVRIYTMFFSYPAVEAITWWDFSDQGAWMNAPSGLLRADMSPKPAYEALRKMIREDWTTRETCKTDEKGSFKLRAFRGDYRLEITLPDGTKYSGEKTMQVGKNTPEIRIELK